MHIQHAKAILKQCKGIWLIVCGCLSVVGSSPSKGPVEQETLPLLLCTGAIKKKKKKNKKLSTGWFQEQMTWTISKNDIETCLCHIIVCAFTYNQTWELFSRVYYYWSGTLHFHILFQITPPQIQLFKISNKHNDFWLLIGPSLLKYFYILIKTNPTTYGSINQGQ